MMATVGQNLYQLQLLDTQLSEHMSRLRETESMLGETRDLLRARAACDKAARELANWRTRLKDLEFELQRLNDKIAATEARLYGGRVTNPKELHGLQQEYQYLKRSRQKLEDEVLHAMAQLEEHEEGSKGSAVRLADVESAWQAEQNRLTREAEELQGEIATLEKKRAGLAATLDQSTRAMYEDLLRKKGGRAVALLVGQTCGGCRVTLPSSRAQIVRQGRELVTCTNCGRILIVGE